MHSFGVFKYGFMRRIVILSLVILLAKTSQSQNKLTDTVVISGKIKNQKGEPVPALQVSFSILDSSGNIRYSTRILTDNKGAFIARVPFIGEARFKISIVSVFYNLFDTTFALMRKNDFGTVSISENSKVLQELVIQKKDISTAPGKIVFKVDDKKFPKNTRAVEVLRQTPLIATDPTGNVLLRGKTKVPVYIDGKLSSQSLLNGFPVEMIDRVEVVTTPDISGTSGEEGYVNIITKKVSTSLLKGNINYNGGLSQLYQSPSLNLFFKSKKFSATLTGNYLWNRQHVTNTLDREDLNKSPVYHQDLYSRFNLQQGGTLLNLFYQPDSKNLFTGQVKLNTIHDIREGTEGGVLTSDNPPTVVNTISNRNRHLHTGLFNLDYTRSFTNSSVFKISSTYSENGGRRINTNDNSDSSDQTEDRSYYREWVIYSTYKFPLKKGGKTSLEAGGIYAGRFNHVHYTDSFSNLISGQNGIDLANSDKYLYRQHLAMAFLNLSFIVKKILVRIGDRFEYTSNQITVKNFHEHYFKMNPSMVLFKNFGKAGSFSVSLRRSVQRPGLSYINNVQFSEDPSSVMGGNMNLSPENYSHYELSYDKYIANKYFFSASLYGDFGSSLIVREIKNRSTQLPTLISVYENGGRSRDFGLSGAISGEVKKVYFNINSYVERNKIEDVSVGLVNTGYVFNVSLYLSKSFKNGYSVSTNLFYTNKDIELLSQRIKRPYLEISVNKNVMKNKFRLGLTYRDAFAMNRWTGVYYYDGFFKQSTEIHNNISNVILFISYNFGKKFNFLKRKSVDVPGDLKNLNQ